MNHLSGVIYLVDMVQLRLRACRPLPSRPCIKCKTLHIPDVMTSCPRTCERNLHGEQNAEMHKVIHEPLKLHGAVCIFVLDWFRLLRLIFCHLPIKIVIFYTCVSYIVHHVSSHISWKSQGRTRISIIRGCHYQYNYQW